MSTNTEQPQSRAAARRRPKRAKAERRRRDRALAPFQKGLSEVHNKYNKSNILAACSTTVGSTPTVDARGQ